MNMNVRKKKEYAVPQMETLELAYEKQVLLEDSERLFYKDGEGVGDTNGEIG
jgi:hypothetical protein